MLKNIFKAIGIAALTVMVAPVFAVEWSSDLDAAKKQAAVEHKLVLIEFTGSDWCTYCIKLNKEVLSTPEFAAFVKQSFIPVQIDVPIRKSFDQELLKRNKEICKQYKVPGYPTLMVLTPQGQVVGGFVGDPGNGIEGAKKHLNAAQKYARILAEAEKLQGLEKARMLHTVYAALDPKMRPSTGLRERIVALDTENVTGVHKELEVEKQRADFRKELAALRKQPDKALELVERYLTVAEPQNKSEFMQAKIVIMLSTAKTVEDILAVKELSLKHAELNPATAERTKRIMEERYANPAEVLEYIRKNPPIW